jgi:hypothetical protein
LYQSGFIGLEFTVVHKALLILQQL